MYYLQPEKVQVDAPSIVYNKQGTQITEPWQVIKFQPYSTTFWKEAALPTATKTNANLGVTVKNSYYLYLSQSVVTMLMEKYKVKVLSSINIVKSAVKIKTDLAAMKKRFKKLVYIQSTDNYYIRQVYSF